MVDPAENALWFRQHTKDLMVGHDDPFERMAQPDTAIGRLFSKTFSEFQPYFSRANSFQDHDFDRLHHQHPQNSSIPASQDSLMNKRLGNELGLFHMESKNGLGNSLQQGEPNPSLLGSTALTKQTIAESSISWPRNRQPARTYSTGSYLPKRAS
jgi:hypothetical protein